MNFALVVHETMETSGSGGARAIYQLAAALQKRGHAATVVVIEDKHAHRDELPEGFPADTIAVYGEDCWRNPLGAKHVVRWIMYNMPTDVQWGEGELVFLYNKQYRPETLAIDGMLTTFAYDRCFSNLGIQRSGTWYLVRKGGPTFCNKPLDKHPADACCLDTVVWPSPLNGGIIGGNVDLMLFNIFNRARRLISYDHHTAYSDFAAICGCEVIVIPDGKRSVQQAIADHTLGLAGQAWGFEDLQRANATRHLIPERIAAHKADCDRMIDRFCRTCAQRFFASSLEKNCCS